MPDRNNQPLKVLFTTSPLSSEERYGVLAGAGSASPSLGILMLAAVARRAGFDCSVVDASALSLSVEELLERLTALGPDVLCLSCTTLGIGNAHRFARQARGALPRLRIVVGGPHVTAIPRETMECCAAFEVAVLGEGEQTLVELLLAFSAGTPPVDVRGLICREGETLMETGRRPFLTDLDSLPFPAWDLLEGFPGRYLPAPFKVRRLPAATLVTTRGCPNACIFCDRSVFGSSCHAYSAGYVVRQMEELHRRYGIREFSFEDDTFVLSRARLEEICSRLADLRLDISWSCLARVNLVTADLLRLMRRAGCWQVGFGIESGSPEVLERCNKGITLDQVRRAVAAGREAGLRTKGFFILGHPGESRETLRATVEFALELPLNDISVSYLTPFPGTEVHARAAEFGTLEAQWNEMNLLTPVFIPHGLTCEELVSTHKELTRRFYLRPRIVLDYGKRLLHNPFLMKSLWQGFKSLILSSR